MTAVPRTQRNREATKRQIMAALSPNNSGSSNDASKKWEQTVRKELDERLGALHDDCESEKNKQQEVFAAAMVKLPRNIKNMTVTEFNSLYKVNLLQNFNNPDLMGTMSSTAKALQTPGTSFSAHRKPLYTPSRTMRKGEILFSQNGSPIEAGGPGDRYQHEENCLVATITKPAPGSVMKGGPTRLLSTSASASLSINVGNGQFISLQDPTGVTKLGDDDKNNALLQLQLLKEQVDTAMKKLQN